MARDSLFFEKLISIEDDYRSLRSYYGKLEEESAQLAANAIELIARLEARDSLIRDLCGALGRAQEIIMALGEASGNAGLLKEAKVYANAIGGIATERDIKPFPHYADNPVIKKHRAKTKPKTKRGRK